MKPKRVLRKWAVTVVGDDVFTFKAVVDGKSVDTGVKAVSVLRTKGKRTVSHGAAIPKGWEKRYHHHCRVALGRSPNAASGYVILRCL